MDQTTWLFLGTFATILSGAVLLTGVDEVKLGLPSAFVWVLFGHGALNVEIVTNCCRTTESYPAIAILMGGGMAVVMLLAFLRGGVYLLHPDKAEQEAMNLGPDKDGNRMF